MTIITRNLRGHPNDGYSRGVARWSYREKWGKWGWKAWVVGVVMTVVMLQGVVLIVQSLHEWRAGTAFFQYRNWEGQLVSHGDILILAVLFPVVLVVAELWSWWDGRHERRSAANARKHHRHEPPAPR